MVAAWPDSEAVHINVNDANARTNARRHWSERRRARPGSKIHFHHFPTNDAWCRDHGAIILTRRDTAQAK